MDAELDRILDDGYLDGLSEMPVAELRQRRAQCQHIETQLSYLRRMVQGRHDIVTGELDRVADGGDPTDIGGLVDRLPAILADRIRGPASGHLPTELEPGELSGRLVERLDAISAQASIGGPAPAEADALTGAADDLADLERDVSAIRRAMFDRIDTLQEQITRRYRDGQADVNEILHRD